MNGRQWHSLRVTLAALALMLAGTAVHASTLDERKQMVLSARAEVLLPDIEPKGGAYHNLIWTARHGCNPEITAAMTEFLLGGTSDDGKTLPYEMFSLPPLVRYLYMFRECLSDAQMQRISDLLSRPVSITGHGTLNHAMLLSTSWYLLAQLFPYQIWTDSNGHRYTSGQIKAMLAENLASRTRKFYQDGYYEQFSPTYAVVNLFPLLNLADLATDKQVANFARAEATLEIALLRAKAFRGRIVPPLTRGHSIQRLRDPTSKMPAQPPVSQHVLWYYFGEPEFGKAELNDRREPLYVAMLALSNYRPPSELIEAVAAAHPPYEVKSITPTFSYWNEPTKPELLGTSYIGRSFALGTANQIIDTGGYNDSNHTFGIYFDSPRSEALVDCYQPYWLSNKGENAWSYDRSSPFQQVHRSGTRGVLVYDIPAQDPFVYDEKNRFFATRNKQASAIFQVAQCRYPAAMDEIAREDETVFLREGNVFIALKALGGRFEPGPALEGPARGYASIKIRNAKTAIYFRVEEGEAPAGFARFIESVKQDALAFDGKTATYRNPDGRAVSVTFTHRKEPDGRLNSVPDVKVDGKPVDDRRLYVVEAPFMRLGNGKLEIIRNSEVVLRIEP